MTTNKLCSDNVIIRLGGLTDGLAYRLRELIGCDIQVEHRCDDDRLTEGKLASVGSEYLEIEREGIPNITIPFSKVKELLVDGEKILEEIGEEPHV
jgi:hypothetical protein